VSLEPCELNVQAVYREDDNPSYFAEGPGTVTRGGFAELVYAPGGDKGKWFAVALYNIVRSDDDALKYETATLSGHYAFARNVRFIGEYTYDSVLKANRFTVGVVTAF